MFFGAENLLQLQLQLNFPQLVLQKFDILTHLILFCVLVEDFSLVSECEWIEQRDGLVGVGEGVGVCKGWGWAGFSGDWEEMCEGSSKLFFWEEDQRSLFWKSFWIFVLCCPFFFFGLQHRSLPLVLLWLFLLPAWGWGRRCFSWCLLVYRILGGHLCRRFVWGGRGGLLSGFRRFCFPFLHHLCSPLLLVPRFWHWYSLWFLDWFLWWIFHLFLRAVPGYMSQLFAEPAVRSLALNNDHHLLIFMNYGVRDFLETLLLQADKEGVVSIFYASAVFDWVDLFSPPIWGEEWSEYIFREPNGNIRQLPWFSGSPYSTGCSL